MKKKKLILSVCVGLCVVLSALVLAIAFCYKEPKHEHVLGENKTYHICNDYIYYTKKCQDGCDVAFETSASLTEIMTNISRDDNIVLDEDVTIKEEIFVQSFYGDGVNPVALDININFDLNGYTISTDIQQSANSSLFMFNVNRGNVNFNIKNGIIKSSDLLYIFRFKNNFLNDKSINVNIDNIYASVKGVRTTPLFIDGCVGVELNCTNSKFISKNSTTSNNNFGVGAFINSDSTLNFTNCYFEGGDGVYIKRGVANFKKCEFVNEGLVTYTPQDTPTFSAIGASFVADSYATEDGYTKIQATIIDCSMISKASSKTIYVIETRKTTALTSGYNTESKIDVQSCKFDGNPITNQIIQYPNSQPPQLILGTQIWACGDITLDN